MTVEPNYATSIWSGFNHITLLSVGEFVGVANGWYDYGGGLNSALATGLFILATFILVIHFMNMLIAIMGEVQQQ